MEASELISRKFRFLRNMPSLSDITEGISVWLEGLHRSRQPGNHKGGQIRSLERYKGKIGKIPKWGYDTVFQPVTGGTTLRSSRQALGIRLCGLPGSHWRYDIEIFQAVTGVRLWSSRQSLTVRHGGLRGSHWWYDMEVFQAVTEDTNGGLPGSHRRYDMSIFQAATKGTNRGLPGSHWGYNMRIFQAATGSTTWRSSRQSLEEEVDTQWWKPLQLLLYGSSDDRKYLRLEKKASSSSECKDKRMKGGRKTEENRMFVIYIGHCGRLEG